MSAAWDANPDDAGCHARDVQPIDIGHAHDRIIAESLIEQTAKLIIPQQRDSYHSCA
jgi:hypothetical protein